MSCNEVPTISLTDGISGEFEIEISRKDKKVCGRILQMPKYKVTEWMFPKKKNRGTIKRKRRQNKQARRCGSSSRGSSSIDNSPR